jgi:hypothetical protein
MDRRAFSSGVDGRISRGRAPGTPRPAGPDDEDAGRDPAHLEPGAPRQRRATVQQQPLSACCRRHWPTGGAVWTGETGLVWDPHRGTSGSVRPGSQHGTSTATVMPVLRELERMGWHMPTLTEDCDPSLLRPTQPAGTSMPMRPAWPSLCPVKYRQSLSGYLDFTSGLSHLGAPDVRWTVPILATGGLHEFATQAWSRRLVCTLVRWATYRPG